MYVYLIPRNWGLKNSLLFQSKLKMVFLKTIRELSKMYKIFICVISNRENELWSDREEAYVANS